MRLLKQRFDRKWKRQPNGCWRWTDVLSGNGYGYLGVGGRKGRDILAHRLAYRLYVGPIPAGMTVDHLCRNRWCVNPAHLEAVSLRVNLLRGDNPAARNARRTHCLRGHPFSGEGADVVIDNLGRRVCRHCTRERKRRQRHAA